MFRNFPSAEYEVLTTQWSRISSFMRQRCNKMKTGKHTKLQVVNHVCYLFAVRPETIRATIWNCVLRDGQLIVVRSFIKEPTDWVIMNYLLEPRKLPSWFSIYLAVRKNWQVLVEANMDVSDAFDIDSPFLLASNGKAHHRRRNWLINCGRFLSWAKSFIRKRTA